MSWSSIKNVSLGADPEVMCVKKDGHPQSVEGLIGGSKENPLPMKGLPDGFYVQEDNVAAEFNIPPSYTAKDFSMNLARGLRYVDKLLKNHGLSAACISAMEFPVEQLATPHAQRLGCEPDLCAWTRKENPRPIPPSALRTAALHVHYGWNEPNDEQRFAVAKMYDVYIGIPSLLASQPNERRKLYGKAGAIRLKYYGVECRMSDNFWLNKKAWREHVFYQSLYMIDLLNRSKGQIIEHVDALGEEIQNCINNHDKSAAIDLIAKFEATPFPLLRA